MNKAQVIEFFCELATTVGREVFDHALAHDCFCHKARQTQQAQLNFYFEREIVEFIQQAVEAKIIASKEAAKSRKE